MHKIMTIWLICTVITGSLQAQLRTIPAEVTDAFRTQYPSATQASWSDKLSYFQVTFSLDSARFMAKYGSKGDWKVSEQNITADRLPAPVKDGYDKSKYTDQWQVKEYTVIYLPGNIMKYRLLIRKSGLQKKYLYFDATGKMLDDSSTL